MMTAELISVGTGYLLGMLKEPVQSYLAGRMTELGITIRGRRIIREDENELLQTLQEVFQNVQTAVLTGGEGTGYSELRETITEYFDEKSSADGSGSEIFLIPSGTGGAEGFVIRDQEDHILIALPGNEEVVDMFEDDVVGYLLKDVAEGKASVVMETSALNTDAAVIAEEHLKKVLKPLLLADNPSVMIQRDRERINLRIKAVGPTQNDALILAQMMAGDIHGRTNQDYSWKMQMEEAK